MNHVLTKTTYLEMFAPPATVLNAPPIDGTRIERLHAPTVNDYRFLYNGVGLMYQWVNRNLMPDDELARIVRDELVEIDVLCVGEQTAGYVELDRRRSDEIENRLLRAVFRFHRLGTGKVLSVVGGQPSMVIWTAAGLGPHVRLGPPRRLAKLLASGLFNL